MLYLFSKRIMMVPAGLLASMMVFGVMILTSLFEIARSFTAMLVFGVSFSTETVMPILCQLFKQNK